MEKKLPLLHEHISLTENFLAEILSKVHVGILMIAEETAIIN